MNILNFWQLHLFIILLHCLTIDARKQNGIEEIFRHFANKNGGLESIFNKLMLKSQQQGGINVVLISIHTCKIKLSLAIQLQTNF